MYITPSPTKQCRLAHVQGQGANNLEKKEKLGRDGEKQ